MKTLILVLVLSLFSCCDNNTTEEISIYYKWSLVKFEPGLSPIKNFNNEMIIWEFHQNGILEISIDNSVDSEPIKPAGEFQFSLNGNRILIDNLEYDFLISNELLIISDNPSSDGFKATFYKIN